MDVFGYPSGRSASHARDKERLEAVQTELKPLKEGLFGIGDFIDTF
jgi:hypothetical protein